MKTNTIFFVLIIGIAIGVAGAIYVPDYINPYLPSAMKAAKGGVDGEVISKLHEDSRLLVTVKTADGSILITFTKKVPEINLLVTEGDIVTLDIKSYNPFINDPRINRVRKPDQKATMSSEPTTEPETMEEAEQPAESVTTMPEEGMEAPASVENAPLTNSAM